MGVFESITKGLNEAIEYEQGKNKNVRTAKCIVSPIPEFNANEIKSVRNSLNMTQNTFAAVMGVSVKTVEAWESGTNKPIGTARRMLSILQKDNNAPIKYDIIANNI